MEDNQSTELPEQGNQPDPILDTLNDVEASEPEEVEESEEVEDNHEADPEEQTEESSDEGTDEAQVDPKEQARRAYEERQQRNALRRQQFTEAASIEIEKSLKNAEDEYDQRQRQVEAKVTEMEVQQYVNNIEHQESLLVNELERAKADPELQIFNPESDVYNPKAWDKALRDYNAGYISYDASGNIIGLKGSLYEHLKETADLLRGAIQEGAINQVRATKQMRATSDVKPAAQPKESKKDAILDILKSD